MNKVERNLEKIFKLVLKIFYYYYFILSIINLICIYFNFLNVLNITTILILIGIIIELFCGYVRGCFGFFMYFISIIFSIYFIKDIWLGISVGLSIACILNVLIDNLFSKFLNFIIKKQ